MTLYRGFYVEIDNSPDMGFIWLGINTGYDSLTYDYSEYPKDTPFKCVKTEALTRVDQLIAAPKIDVGIVIAHQGWDVPCHRTLEGHIRRSQDGATNHRPNR